VSRSRFELCLEVRNDIEHNRGKIVGLDNNILAEVSQVLRNIEDLHVLLLFFLLSIIQLLHLRLQSCCEMLYLSTK